MKKIIGALLCGAMIGGAFAEASIGVNARVYTDAFSYTSASESSKKTTDANSDGVDDKGTITWFKDTKHADDVTLSASNDNAGAKLVFSVATDSVSMTSYQLWLKKGGFRLDAGTFDTRPINLASYDGNWGSNYCGFAKPGAYSVVKGDYAGASKHAVDAGNLTILEGAKKKANVMMASYAFKDLGLNVRAAVFLTGATTPADYSSSSVKTPFVPFGVQADYKIGKAATIAATIKMVDAKTASKYVSNGKGDGKTKAGNNGTYIYDGVNYTAVATSATLAKNTEYFKKGLDVGYSEWTFNVEGLITAIDKTKILVGYTLDAAFAGKDADGESSVGNVNYSDNNEYIHSFDLRVENTSVDKLSLYAYTQLSYMPATKFTKDSIGDWNNQSGFENEAAYKNKNGLNGKLGMWVTFGAAYKASDALTVGLQGKYTCTNFFDTIVVADGTASGKTKANASKNMGLNIRPQVDITFAKGCQFSAGVDIGFSNFSKSKGTNAETKAVEDFSNMKTTVSVPLLMRVKL